MPLDPHAQRFLEILAATRSADGSRASLGDRRRAFGRLMNFTGPATAVGKVEDLDLAGPDGRIGARLYRPLDAPAGPLPGMVFFHGGGFVAGSLDTHDALCRTLANDSGCAIVSVAYRLAPEHRFPAAPRDGRAAMEWVLQHANSLGLDPARIGAGGDSAGATLAAGVCHAMRESAGPKPAFQLLLCPITDLAGTTPSRREFASGYLLDQATLEGDRELYLPAGMAATDPLVSPLRCADFRALPRAFIHTAEYDPLRDEGAAYGDSLRAAGVAVSYTCHPGMIHVFYAMPGIIPYARGAMSRLGADIRAALR